LNGKVSIVLILIVCILISLTGGVTSFKEGFKDAGLSSALKEKDYEVLGSVTMHSAITNILGFISFGGRGYEELLEIAKEQYEDCDAVINIYEDVDTSIILGVYNKFKHNYTGTAIKFI